MAPVLVADNLTKYYGARLAVDRVSFEVQAREVLGLLGPNGSGKSTVLRILAGYLRPTTGSARLAELGLAIGTLEARAHVAYVPEDAPLYPQMRVVEFLEFMGRVRGVPSASLPAAIGQAIERLSLGSVRQQLIWKLSRGYRQRVAIAQALLGRPRLLILDEPTNGLDPRQIIEVRELIRSLSSDLSVMVSSHMLAEVERVAHRVAILLRGRLLTVHTLGADATRLLVRIRGTEDAAVQAAVRALPGIELLECRPAAGIYLLGSRFPPAASIRALIATGLQLEEVGLGTGLEELFLRLTEEVSA